MSETTRWTKKDLAKIRDAAAFVTKPGEQPTTRAVSFWLRIQASHARSERERCFRDAEYAKDSRNHEYLRKLTQQQERKAAHLDRLADRIEAEGIPA